MIPEGGGVEEGINGDGKVKLNISKNKKNNCYFFKKDRNGFRSFLVC